jgi:amidase
MTSQNNWEKVAEAKRATLAASIPQEYRVPTHQLPPESQLDVTPWPKESGWFSSEELVITDSTATEILQKVAAKTWSSEKVTRAFCKRAAAAQQLVGQRCVSCVCMYTG